MDVKLTHRILPLRSACDSDWNDGGKRGFHGLFIYRPIASHHEIEKGESVVKTFEQAIGTRLTFESGGEMWRLQ